MQLRNTSGENHKPWNVAVLEASDPDRHFISGAIRAMGIKAVEFSTFGDLAQILQQGHEFDLLLASLPDEPRTVHASAKYLQHVTDQKIALILLMRAEQLLGNNPAMQDAYTDFVLMPCEECELSARIARALAYHDDGKEESYKFGQYTFHPEICSISIDGTRTRFQPRQFELALYLFRNSDRAHSRDEIFREVWKIDSHLARGRTIDIHIAKLRKFLQETSWGKISISSIRGFGYRLLFAN